MGDEPASKPAAAPGQKFPPNAVHLVRTVQQINVQLSQMADQKASILMGATFVVFTISIGQARGGDVSAPLVVLAFFSFVSAMLAVFAVLPKTKPSPGGNPNMLFFGTFTQMSEQEFADGVIEALRDEETLYRAMLRDVYQNGQVLQRKKYRFLGLAYKTFLVGLVLTFTSFAAQYLFQA
ncbi:Pycsar system effector family protein [Sphingomonas cavernae]|uniref:Pycsar effector protein domain-containing protein n=1 Tax=Sphingomonas cavernae TaxID=2320861 RepID=A0A418W7M2_9SPHN|nr:Pycsar system effector family protein [Sphingomonas cavernae]RJF85991.1 hypothetical protein D3876_19345 [Sphingomonas cavernae]